MAAASFLTPLATPANLMVMGPGGYRFGNYWKLGLPLVELFGVVAVLLATGLLYRLATFYLPPLRGFFAMRWLRRNALL